MLFWPDILESMSTGKTTHSIPGGVVNNVRGMARQSLAVVGLQRIPNSIKQKMESFESPFLDPSTGDEYKEICRAIQRGGMRIDPDLATNFTAYNIIKYVSENNISGDIVECGVGNGIKMRIMAEYLHRHGKDDRRLFLYDTYAGMTAPTVFDTKPVLQFDVLQKWKLSQKETHNTWYYIPLERVQRNVYASEYPKELIYFVKGNVLQTLPNATHECIALLRLDTDFYDSSKHELECLYDLVPKDGAVIFDDYGGWEGQKKATDEFFAKRKELPLLHRTCRIERVIIK